MQMMGRIITKHILTIREIYIALSQLYGFVLCFMQMLRVEATFRSRQWTWSLNGVGSADDFISKNKCHLFDQLANLPLSLQRDVSTK